MDKAVKVHTTIAKHENLLVLRWEGFKRTASDELYHAVWANTEGVRNFRLPFQSEVVKFNKNALADPYKTVGPSEKGWIAEISVDRHVLELALKNGDVMEEGSYREMCDAEEDEDEHSARTKLGKAFAGIKLHRMKLRFGAGTYRCEFDLCKRDVVVSFLGQICRGEVTPVHDGMPCRSFGLLFVACGPDTRRDSWSHSCGFQSGRDTRLV